MRENGTARSTRQIRNSVAGLKPGVGLSTRALLTVPQSSANIGADRQCFLTSAHVHVGQLSRVAANEYFPSELALMLMMIISASAAVARCAFWEALSGHKRQ